MKTTLKEQSPFSMELTVSLDSDELGTYVTQARKQASQGLEVNGFRKGKVPEDVAKEQLSDGQLREAALQFAMEESFSKAVSEQKWDVAMTEELNVKKNTPEELTYTVLVRLWPNVELGDVKQFSVPRKPVTVDDAKFTEAVDTLRNMKASFLVKEGAVAEGDRVELDFSATKDGKAVPGAEGKNHPLVVGGSTFMPGFEEQLVGLRAGDTKEFDLTAPKDYAYTELAGSTLHFMVTVNTVQIVMRPEVNDNFAKTLKYDSVDALNTAVRESVLAQERIKERDRVRLAIMDTILSGIDIATPDFLVEQELEQMVGRFETDLQSKGLGLDLYLARLNKTRDDIKKQWKKEAERQVRMSLIVRQVIKDRRIVPNEADVESTLKDTLARLSGQEGFDPGSVDMDALRRTVADRIVTEQALGYLEQSCATA